MAFAVPIIQKWAQDPFGVFAVVLTPTRYVGFLFFLFFFCPALAESCIEVLLFYLDFH